MSKLTEQLRTLGYYNRLNQEDRDHVRRLMLRLYIEDIARSMSEPNQLAEVIDLAEYRERKAKGGVNYVS